MKFYKKRWIQSGIILISSLGIVLSVFPSFADDNIDNLKGQTSALESELDGINKDILSLSEEISATEMQVEILNGEIARTSDALVEAEENENEQYENMKSRIKYMYEDQSTSIAEAFLTAESMSDALNKAEYVQQVYDYDRGKLDEMAATASQIHQLKSTLDADKKELEALGQEMTDKQAVLYAAIADQENTVADLTTQLSEAQAAAAEAQRQREAQAAAAAAKTTTKTKSSTTTTVAAANNSGSASGVVSAAYSMLGVPYVWGGYSPSGFDCSGFVSWVINNCGNGWNIGRCTADELRSHCSQVSPSEAKPGDLIFFQGTYNTSGASHVGIYVGNNMMIHCGKPVQYTSIASSYWQEHFMAFGRLH